MDAINLPEEIDFQMIWDFLDKEQTANRKEYTPEEQKELYEKFMKWLLRY